MDKERKVLKRIPGNANYNLNSPVTDIREDKTGAIWLCLPNASAFGPNKATTSKLLRVSINEQTVMVLSEENGYNIPGNQVEEDNLGNFWIAGHNEIFILNKDKKSSKTIGINSRMVSTNRKPSLLKRKDGTLWFATLDKGIVIANDFTLQNGQILIETTNLAEGNYFLLLSTNAGEAVYQLVVKH